MIVKISGTTTLTKLDIAVYRLRRLIDLYRHLRDSIHIEVINTSDQKLFYPEKVTVAKNIVTF